MESAAFPAVEVYRDPHDLLRDHLVRAALLVRRYIVQHGDRMLGDQATLDDTHVATNEALAFFDRRRRDLPALSGVAGRERTLDNIDEQLADWDTHMEARAHATRADPTAARHLLLDELGAAFGLDDTARQVIAFLAAVEMDVGLRRVCRYAIADGAVRHLTVGFLHELLACNSADHARLWDTWRRDRPLRHHGLIVVGAGEALFERSIALWPRVAGFLRGERLLLDERIEAVASLESEVRRLGQLVLADALDQDGIAVALSRSSSTRAAAARLALWGPPNVGKRTLMAAVAAEVGSPMLVVRAAALLAAPAAHPLLLLVLAEARLLQAFVYVDIDDVPPTTVDALRQLLETERRRLAELPSPVVVGGAKRVDWVLHAIDDVVEFHVPLPDVTSQIALWTQELGDEPTLRAFPFDSVVSNYRLPPGSIVRAADEARRMLALERDGRARGVKPSQPIETLWAAARHQLNQRLGTVAEPITTSVRLQDVVLPDDIVEGMTEILDYARHQQTVFEQWGFGSKINYGRGLSVLFSGPPGTGKTLMAGILAGELGRELFRIDLSRVVDKFIGETEKNLGRVFDEAERAQTVLLFDEADSLFAKRTTVSSSNDRYANLEVNYLLQRMEDFSGVSILTTNFESSLDEAFKRRLRFSIKFRMPDAEERVLIWKALIPVPAQPRLAHDIDWPLLAHRFEMSGGYIKNAVIRAAINAARSGGTITMQHLVDAATRIYQEMGKVVAY